MSIYDDVTAQMKAAMKAKDKPRLSALRGIRTVLINAKKEDNSETVADDRAIGLLRSLSKQRKDSIKAYADAGRDDLVEQESGELAVIEQFLPQLADADQTRVWVKEAIATSGASTPREIGKAMGALMRAHKGDLDGALARSILQEELGG
jgi:uncharacterized protein YqeY